MATNFPTFNKLNNLLKENFGKGSTLANAVTHPMTGISGSNNTNGSGGGSGGSGGSSGPTDEQKRAAGNLGGITGYNIQTLTNKAGQGDKVYDIADQQNKNMQTLQTLQNKRNAGNDWYTQQQKLQNVTSQVADASGNSMYGSFALDFADSIARKNDMDAVAVLNQQRENQNQLDNDYFEALMAINNSRNELYMDTEADMREVAADYAAQLNNIHPDLANDVIDSGEHTLNIPSWLQTSYFDSHVRDAIQPETQALYRPENAAVTATQQGLVNKDTTSQYSSSGNNDYWTRMRQGYQRRTQ